MSIFDVELFARTVRKEWIIENNLHWYLDYTLKEDASTSTSISNVPTFVASSIIQVSVGSIGNKLLKLMVSLFVLK